ncbi:hypothetical protein [Flexistipes sp.]|uniref:hypothetical protein n=1 Tax=Flexistipes sp. TaxID=3088135 RepID=UPI002E24912F|nr:hypothetical protein [Flexistipes sp.]
MSNREWLLGLIKRLNDLNNDITKIVLQKITFFLQELGEPCQYTFEGYKYGPFSHGLASEIQFLEQEGFIDIEGNSILFKDNTEPIREKDEKLDNRLTFLEKEIFNFDHSFNKMELLGTMLYCKMALEELGDETCKDNVFKEFKSWKGDKFTEEDLENAYQKVQYFLNKGKSEL